MFCLLQIGFILVRTVWKITFRVCSNLRTENNNAVCVGNRCESFVLDLLQREIRSPAKNRRGSRLRKVRFVMTIVLSLVNKCQMCQIDYRKFRSCVRTLICTKLLFRRLAFQEILREAKRGKERSEEMGSSGWWVWTSCRFARAGQPWSSWSSAFSFERGFSLENCVSDYERISFLRQKPKVPPTNKRFLQNTLLSTLPRKRRRQSEDRDAPSVPTCDSSGAAGVKCEETEVDEGIKPEIDEKINEYRKQLAQNYEDEKHHRRQKAEESKIFNKASARALKRAEVEKKKFDQVMRYGVKVGAKKERVAQGKKKAIFDRYRGVWKPLDKTYHKPESHSDSDSNTEEPPSDYIRHDFRRGMDREDCPGEFHPRDRGGRDGEAWNAYTAAMYNYYYHQYQQKYDIVPSSGREYGGREYYKYESDQSEDSVKKYEHRSRRRPNDHTDETDSSESGNKKTRKHKSKRQKHKKQKKSKKSKKSSKAKRRTQESSDSEGSGLSQRRKKRKVASDVEDMFCGSHEPDTVANSERFSQSNDEAGETNSQSLTVTVGGSDSDDESRRGKKSKHKSKHRKSRT